MSPRASRTRRSARWGMRLTALTAAALTASMIVPGAADAAGGKPSDPGGGKNPVASTAATPTSAESGTSVTAVGTAVIVADAALADDGAHTDTEMLLLATDTGYAEVHGIDPGAVPAYATISFPATARTNAAGRVNDLTATGPFTVISRGPLTGTSAGDAGDTASAAAPTAEPTPTAAPIPSPSAPSAGGQGNGSGKPSGSGGGRKPRSSTGSVTAALTTTPLPAASTHQVTVVRAYATGQSLASAPAMTTMTGNVGASSSYWSGQTSGVVRFAVARTVDGVAAATPPCGTGGSISDFLTQVMTKVGWSTAGEAAGNHLVIAIPNLSACGWAGLGTIGSGLGSGGWAIVNGSTLPMVTQHELGHNISFGHSNLLSCVTAGAQMFSGGGCTTLPYYNTYTVMGFSTSEATGAVSGQDLVSRSLVAPVVLSGAGQQVTLPPIGSGLPGRVAQFNAGGDLYTVEYRYPTGSDSGVGGWNRPAGVVVSRSMESQTGFSARATYLIDPTPSPAGLSASDGSPVMPVGSWRNFGGGAVRVEATSSVGATITFSPDVGAPIVPVAAANPTYPVPYSVWASTAGAQRVDWTTPGQAGVAYALTDRGTKSYSTTPGASAPAGIGWNTSMVWRTRACSSGGCILSASTTGTRSASHPMNGAWSIGTAGDGIITVSVSEQNTTSASLHSGWRVMWCDTRLYGSTCDPSSVTGRGYTTILTGAKTVTMNLVAKTAKVGTTSVLAAGGGGMPAKGDTFRVTIIAYRAGDNTVTKGWRLPSDGTTRNVVGYIA